jgi:hypothetical protein
MENPRRYGEKGMMETKMWEFTETLGKENDETDKWIS